MSKKKVAAVNHFGNWGLLPYEVVKDSAELPLNIDKYAAAKWDENQVMGMSSP